MTQLNFVTHLAELVTGVDVVLCDVWGVIHNGIESFPSAVAALRRFRREGGTVILITNAPRLADSVRQQVRDLGVSDDCYDAIVSSGDLTHHYVAAHKGRPLFWLGPNRDASIYRDLDAPFVPLEQADYMICTGLLDDDTETAEDYRAMMEKARARGLTMVCANPDIVVQRGDQLIHCAGAIAELYAGLGGEVIYYGKPYAPIYQRALELAGECRGQPIARDRVLAIGDSLSTDVAGAHGYGIDCVFITRGIHAGEFDGGGRDGAAQPLFDAPPKAAMRDLAW